MVPNNHNGIFNKVTSLDNKITDMLKLDFWDIFDLVLHISQLIAHNNKAYIIWIQTSLLLKYEKEGEQLINCEKFV